MAESKAIPEPPAYPIVGHLGVLNPDFPLGSLVQLSDQYGEIYRLRFPNSSIVICSTHELVDELCDEKRFEKRPEGPLKEIRNLANDGLFTAFIDEPNWGIAHRVLMPAFGPVSIRGMFDEMHDIASQLAMKWARGGPNQAIAVTDDFTRLALDTLALCSMDYRFNSFYTPELHPFLEAMQYVLVESGNRARRPRNLLTDLYYRNTNTQYFENIELMRKTAREVLEHRVANKSNRKDLLTAMLDGVDSKTGQKMTQQSIVDNLITFLIAGHETTSGLLSFTFYSLVKHPEVYRKAQEEVDQVVGSGQINIEHLSKLPYISAILREVLRVFSPISLIGVQAKEPTLLGNKYPVQPGEGLLMLLKKAHVDPAVYGADADLFKPERMLDEEFNKLPRNAWKPFGNGQRGCIGRPFAWQEALLVTAMLLQNFNFVLDDATYELSLKQTLTIKPKDLRLRAILRGGLTPTMMEHRIAGTQPSSSAPPSAHPDSAGAKIGFGRPLTVLYGSNSGTCEALAQRIAADAPAHGFQAVTVDCMDTANGRLPKDQPVVVITASYEGQPPDNAGLFVSWLENAEKDTFKDVKYAVFGCGHHDWATTFHRVPKLVDDKLEKGGAARIAPIGLADAAAGDIFTAFDAWEDDTFWPALTELYGITESADLGPQGSGINVEVSRPRSSILRQDVSEAVVVKTQVLTAPGEPVKKAMEIKLPSDKTYKAGDYLAVLPINPKKTVARAMRRFELPWDAHLKITADQKTPLPTGETVPANDVLGAYVELSQPATKKNLLTLVEATTNDKVKAALQNLASDLYAEEIVAKRTSVLDLLEKYPSVSLPLGSFLAMLPPMRVRQYSISSSPLWNSGNLTITFSVLDAPSKSHEGRHIGVASSYLDSLEAGDKLHVAVRPSHAAFHLPSDAESTPVIMVAAGTGLAPFRGFIQERAAMIGASRKLAPAHLFYGCREPGKDDLYAEELAQWERAGAVTIHHAYSRTPEKAGGNKYAQDAFWADRETVMELWDKDAKLYICGSRGVGQGVAEAAVKMAMETQKERYGFERTEEQVQAWWERQRNARYATDVFD